MPAKSWHGEKEMAMIFEALSQIGLVPVITIDRPQDAVPLAQALLDGDIACAEVTFRTAAAAEAIHLMSTERRGMLIGAGTVLTVQQAEHAAQAGARYIVSPGFDPSVVDWCQTHHLPVLPGAATPTEIMMALAKGLTLLKFFPAEVVGGVRMLEMLYGPYPEVSFVPTGGITSYNLAQYLALPNVVACGGSWMATKSMIADHKFEEIARASRAARAIVRQVRGEREAGR
jgi:2-dehydro-3-deoxyphosphogluconate aldolase/(4S)-4-hydroxy-2-oxoglutarate aldolase